MVTIRQNRLIINRRKKMSENMNYDDAVKTIKLAILQSQYDAAKSVNEKQLQLYYGIGKYISVNSRNGFWGSGAVDVISDKLDKELPGLKGFSARNLRYMRSFYEEWSELDNNILNLEPAGSKLLENERTIIRNPLVPKDKMFPTEAFFSIGFSHHRTILWKVKSREERLFYIQRCAEEKLSRSELVRCIETDTYHHQGSITNNFQSVLPDMSQALRAINTFKDQYMLDFINVEELDARDADEVDERVLENAIIHNIKKFIMTFGKDFTFIRNQYHLEAFGENQYIDLLFFNRALNCLVAVELKTGKFKTAYLGQLQGYLSILDGFEKKPHENPAIGIILCKDMNKAFVDYVIQDFTKPMGVATYKTAKDMSDELRRALPNIDDLRRLLEENN